MRFFTNAFQINVMAPVRIVRKYSRILQVADKEHKSKRFHVVCKFWEAVIGLWVRRGSQ